MKTSRPETSRASRATRTAAALIASSLVREEVARELAAVRAERVRLDELGAGVDVAEVHVEHALGRAEVRLLRAAQPRDGAREQRAHAAVGDDRRPGGETFEEAAHGVGVDGAAFHPAGDGDELAGDVARELVGGEDDDRARDVLGDGDLAQRHRPAESLDERRVERAARHRRVRPARRDGVDAAERRDPHDLVLEAEQQPALDRRLRRGVVGVPGLAEAAGGRADEDEVAVPGALDARGGSRAP